MNIFRPSLITTILYECRSEWTLQSVSDRLTFAIIIMFDVKYLKYKNYQMRLLFTFKLFLLNNLAAQYLWSNYCDIC